MEISSLRHSRLCELKTESESIQNAHPAVAKLDRREIFHGYFEYQRDSVPRPKDCSLSRFQHGNQVQFIQTAAHHEPRQNRGNANHTAGKAVCGRIDHQWDAIHLRVQ